MVVKRKVSLSGDGPRTGERGDGGRAASEEVLDLFFNTGIVFHEIELPEALPDVVSSFVVMREAAAVRDGWAVRRATGGEEPDVEISALDHLGELSNRWLPVPYQLSCPHCVQVFLSPAGGKGGRARALLAVDTLERQGARGRQLDASLDEGRPFRPLDKDECSGFLDHPETREFLRRLERAGLEKAPFKLASLLEMLSPLLPRIRLSRGESRPAVPVSLVLDFGNSRSSALLVEARDRGLFAVPLEIRSSSDPFQITDEYFDARVTFLPSPFDREASVVAAGDSFTVPSVVRLGREALDRALETPHRFACGLSSPKRYLWDDRPAEDRWHFATPIQGDYRPVFGRLLKYVVEESGGLELRQDGPSTPVDPRYAPRTMMLFAIAEIVFQAFCQVNAPKYRRFQGREASCRTIQHVALTFPSGMPEEEKQVYDALVRNAVVLVTGMLGVPPERCPNYDPASRRFSPFLFADEALAAQMVYLYQEVAHTFAGVMEDFVRLYGKDGKVRIASIDIGGGTSDVMIAEYADQLAGAGTSLSVKKLFQDGVSIAGDEVCRAIVEDVVFAQILHQLPPGPTKGALVHLFAEGDAGHGEAWRTLKAKLVPYFWMPLARAFWAVAEGFELPEHSSEKLYGTDDVFSIFAGGAFSPVVVAEADRFLALAAPGFPGLRNLFFRFDREEIERAIEGVLREPLRRYADIMAQFDVDILILAGRTSALRCIEELFLAEMPVSPPRIKTMSRYRVGDWYPSRWRERGLVKDPKSTVTAGGAVLHLASKNALPGFTIDRVEEAEPKPIYGVYQEAEPHIGRGSELFRGGPVSPPFVYTSGMMIGFRNVDSQEMDGSPLFEVRPASPEVEAALLEDRVSLSFELTDTGRIAVREVKSQRDLYSFGTDAFKLCLKTAASDRYWLDTGAFRGILRYL